MIPPIFLLIITSYSSFKMFFSCFLLPELLVFGLWPSRFFGSDWCCSIVVGRHTCSMIQANHCPIVTTRSSLLTRPIWAKNHRRKDIKMTPNPSTGYRLGIGNSCRNQPGKQFPVAIHCNEALKLPSQTCSYQSHLKKYEFSHCDCIVIRNLINESTSAG